jgi:hypothetical protein
METNPFFKEITEQFGRYVAKGFIKNSTVTELPKDTFLCKAGQDI